MHTVQMASRKHVPPSFSDAGFHSLGKEGGEGQRNVNMMYVQRICKDDAQFPTHMSCSVNDVRLCSQ